MRKGKGKEKRNWIGKHKIMNKLKSIEQDNYYLNLYKKQIRQDIEFFMVLQ